MIDASDLPKAETKEKAEQALGDPTTTKDEKPTTHPRIVIEGGTATRVARLVQMHNVAAQLDAGDADAVRETVERQVGKLIVEAVRA